MEELIPITFFMCVTAVMILRPITKRLGALLEVMTRERMPVRIEDPNSARTAALLEQVSQRLDSIEDRLDFTERLVSSRRTEPRRQFQRARVEADELDYIAP